MKMQKKYWMPLNRSYAILFALFYAFTGFTQNTIIENENLKMEIDKSMKTRISSKFEDAKPLMDNFVASEKLVLPLAEITEFKVTDVSVGTIEGDLKGKLWKITGSYQKADIHIEKQMTIKIYNGFPDLLSTQVSYTNKSNRGVFIEKWVNNNYRILSQ